MGNPCTHDDSITGERFAYSWNSEREWPSYSLAQFTDWFLPIDLGRLNPQSILELGCGNGSLLKFACELPAKRVVGVDIGEAAISAREHLKRNGLSAEIHQADLLNFQDRDGFDLVYCIGVIHHLTIPSEGLRAVLRNVRPGGRFHCWVYGKEGNAAVIAFVEPLRKLCRTLPGPVIRWLIALPLTGLVYLFAQIAPLLPREAWRAFPLAEYFVWLSKRNFRFMWHVVLDQLIAYRTTYFSMDAVNQLICSMTEFELEDIYIRPRNGNSWSFGGIRK